MRGEETVEPPRPRGFRPRFEGVEDMQEARDLYVSFAAKARSSVSTTPFVHFVRSTEC